MATRIVFITGANSGVGYATTKVIASASERFHIIMACRNLEKANKAKSEIEASGIKGVLSTVQLDVKDESAIKRAVAHVDEKFGRLDVLINNAAVGSMNDHVKTRLQECMETNVIGPAVLADAMRPLLLKSPEPYSVYVSSGVGSMGRATDPTSLTYRSLAKGEAYRASKAALNMIAIQESIVYSDTALKVFAMCPGFVRSMLRGPSEEAISGWGGAGDPMNSGKTILSIIQGERDADMGKLIQKDGTYPW